MNDIIRQHFLNPQNLGKIKKPTYKHKYKSGFCGDMVEVYVTVENDIITDVKYNVFGCYAVIATSSILSEYIKGKNVNILNTLTYEMVSKMLGDEIEAEKVSCVETAIKGFSGLIN